MYFSLITPRAQSGAHALPQAAQVLNEHQWLWRFFNAAPGTERPFLFRRQEGGPLPQFYLLSSIQPQMPAACSDWWQLRSREYDPQPQPGSLLEFDLRLNPTVSGPTPAELREGQKRLRGQKHDVVMHAKKLLLAKHGLQHMRDWDETRHGPRPAAQEIAWQACRDWLQSRQQDWGVSIEWDSLQIDAPQQHLEPRKPAPDSKQDKPPKPLQYTSVDVRGVLRVTDADKLRARLLGGIGRAKAFGCGLLLVRPASPVW